MLLHLPHNNLIGLGFNRNIRYLLQPLYSVWHKTTTLGTPMMTAVVPVLVGALLFFGVVPAPIMLWFCLGLVCAAMCLRVTRPAQFLDASQASGSFALSLLTGAPRSETASLLLLPPSHSGLLHLAMLDRDWLPAGGSLLFGSPGKSNRLTDQDLAQLTTHVHDVNCKHCNIVSSNSSYSYAPVASSKAGPTLQSVLPPAAPAAAGSAAAAAVANSQSVLQFAPASVAGHSTQRQFWSSTNLQQGLWAPSSSNGSSNGSSNAAVVGAPVAAAASAWRVPTPPLPPLPPMAGTQHYQQQQYQQQQQQYSHDDSDWFSLGHGSSATAAAAGAATAGATAAAAGATGLRAAGAAFGAYGAISSSNGGSSGGQLLPLPSWGAQAASAVSELARAPAPQHAGLYRSSNGGSSGSFGALNPTQGLPHGSRHGSTGGWAAASADAAAATSGGGAAVAGMAAAAAAAVSAGGAQWPGAASGAPCAAAAAMSAHQSSLTQSTFHQSLLKAWDSYASLDSLDDANVTVCSICLGSYKAGALVTGLPCGHMYHKDCVMPWLLQQGRKSTCPMCKAEVFA